jgi:hypothetical protein
MLFICGARGQNTDLDKADADNLLYNELKTALPPASFKTPVISNNVLKKTNEDHVFMVVGKSFQVESLRSDFYVRHKGQNNYEVLYDARYPLESFVNLLMNKVAKNNHSILITHHQYGNVIKKLKMPMTNMFNLLGRTMDIYCFVTSISKHKVNGVLVFHNPNKNMIHMFEVSADTRALTKDNTQIEADLYSNIPQDNIRTLFKENISK